LQTMFTDFDCRNQMCVSSVMAKRYLAADACNRCLAKI